MTLSPALPRARRLPLPLPLPQPQPSPRFGPAAAHPAPRCRATGRLSALELGHLTTLSLQEVLAVAALQTRVDRKYLVPQDVARAVVRALEPTHGVLSIAGRLTTSYASLYFDSVDWQALRAHAQDRRRRWKVRTRLYREDGLCRLELKTKQAGNTVKHSLDVAAEAFAILTDHGRAFLTQHLSGYGLEVDVDGLLPGVRIDYARATLCDVQAGTRLTIDGELVSTLYGKAVRLRTDHVLMETKGGIRPSTADAVLRTYGVRACSISKYSTTLALLDPTLPGHRFRPFGRRYFEPLVLPVGGQSLE